MLSTVFPYYATAINRIIWFICLQLYYLLILWNFLIAWSLQTIFFLLGHCQKLIISAVFHQLIALCTQSDTLNIMCWLKDGTKLAQSHSPELVWKAIPSWWHYMTLLPNYTYCKQEASFEMKLNIQKMPVTQSMKFAITYCYILVVTVRLLLPTCKNTITVNIIKH